jgi:hypothetical protein
VLPTAIATILYVALRAGHEVAALFCIRSGRRADSRPATWPFALGALLFVQPLFWAGKLETRLERSSHVIGVQLQR